MSQDISSTSASEKENTTLAAVETLEFVEFGQWIDTQLEQLVARWIHTAAPNAKRCQFGSSRVDRNSGRSL